MKDGWGEGSAAPARNPQVLKNPHPNPLPEYREREQECRQRFIAPATRRLWRRELARAALFRISARAPSRRLRLLLLRQRRGEGPDVAVGVGRLAVAVAPEHVLGGHGHGRAGVGGALQGGVAVAHVLVDRDRRPAQ